jgi:hypothetical protein
MTSLLAQLRPKRGPLSTLGLVGLGAMVLLSGAAYVRSVRHLEPTPCAGMDTHLAGVWDVPRHDAVREAILRTSVPFAERAWNAAERSLDAYAKRWTVARTEACVATRVRRERSEAVLDAQMACLDERLRDLRAEVTVLASIEPKDMPKIAVSVAGIPRPETCLGATLPDAFAPRTATAREELDATSAMLARARALHRAGREKETLESAKLAAEKASAIGFDAGQAEGLYLVAAATARMSDQTAPNARYEALDRAEAAKLDALRAQILIDVVYVDQQAIRLAEASALAPIARAAIRRAGDPPRPPRSLRKHSGSARGATRLLRAFAHAHARFGAYFRRPARPE